ncbi:hypothetical protein J4475_00010 [Candidatus Woesearchaeota archaeon]|nr:hypothetical protein [Candidatus Woesearchaeota archaeon]
MPLTDIIRQHEAGLAIVTSASPVDFSRLNAAFCTEIMQWEGNYDTKAMQEVAQATKHLPAYSRYAVAGYCLLMGALADLPEHAKQEFADIVLLAPDSALLQDLRHSIRAYAAKHGKGRAKRHFSLAFKRMQIIAEFMDGLTLQHESGLADALDIHGQYISIYGPLFRGRLAAEFSNPDNFV